MTLKAKDLEFMRELAYRLSGIVLQPDREYLIESRLTPLVEQEGAASVEDLIARIRNDPRQWKTEIRRKLVEAFTTRETFFFRDARPFEVLRTIVFPELSRTRATERMLNLWSTACSSGQEPYSLAMTIREHFPALLNWDLSILASDISEEALAAARAGIYTSLEIKRGLPKPLREKYFQQEESKWLLSKNVRQMVEFFSINLVELFPPLPLMDLVYSRNVLIYFDEPTKMKILPRLCQQVKPGGYLFLDVVGKVPELADSFVRVDLNAGCYQRKGV
jgi:chemotaxis protein methyltransferase CheR